MPIIANDGNIGSISAGRDILATAPITASGTGAGMIQEVFAGGSIAAAINAANGVVDYQCNGIGSTGIRAGIDITGNITSNAGTLGLIFAGHDISLATLSTSDIQDIYAGGNLSVSGSLTASGGIDGGIWAGGQISGTISAVGAIGLINAGVTDGSYLHSIGITGDDAYTLEGSITHAYIKAASIGDVTVQAAIGFDAMIGNSSFTTTGGDIGDITATSGMNATVSSYGSIGNITVNAGDIIGNIVAVHANIRACDLRNCIPVVTT